MVLTPRHITPIALSETLGAEISSVNLRPASDNWGAAVTFLDVEYANPTELPESFALKNGKQDAPRTSAQREVEFYLNIVPATLDKTMLPDVYHTQLGDGGSYHILLKNYQATHISSGSPFELDDARLEQAVVALAQFHGQWWGNSSLRDSLPAVEDLLDHPHARQKTFNIIEVGREFLAANQNLTSNERRLYEHLLDDYPVERIFKRIHRDRWFTITHGDMWHGNVLFGDVGAILIDWPNWSVGHPAFDLAYLICLASTPHDIKSREANLVDRYLTILSRFSGFSANEMAVFRSDYDRVAKKSVALLPLWLWKDGQEVWKPVYKRLLALL